MDAPSRPAHRLPPVLLFVVLAALLFGVAAALLSGVPPTPTNLTHTPGGFVSYWELEVFGNIVIGLVVVWVVYRVIQRIRDPSGAQFAKGPVMVWAVGLLLVLGFLVAVHFVGGGSPAPLVPTGPGGNSNGSMPPPTGKPLNASPSNFTVGAETFPGWVAYALVIGVAIVAVFVAVPLALALSGRKPAVVLAPSEADAARAAIVATLAELESDPNADPRALIVALYGRLLTTVDAHLVETGSRTAREVQSSVVARWHISNGAAEELTRLFEEARYSVHPMGRGDSERARAALERVLAAIDRRPPP
ncbi:MAG TPA: DUF4129 domain-containing protein [Thermoplasmata archaeon]|nr:DUF4129 domain-containing protein [Thermoplasmata archaeon]